MSRGKQAFSRSVSLGLCLLLTAFAFLSPLQVYAEPENATEVSAETAPDAQDFTDAEAWDAVDETETEAPAGADEPEMEAGAVANEAETEASAQADEMTAATDAPEMTAAVSENSAADALAAEGDGNPVLRFYDSDGSTQILNPITAETGSTLMDALASVDSSYIKAIRRGYDIYKWQIYEVVDGNRTLLKTHTPKYMLKNTAITIQHDLDLVAVWDDEPFSYEIEYNLNDGFFSKDSPKDSFTITSDTLTLPAPSKAGYLFDGWYRESTFANKITSIPKGTYFDTPMDGTDVSTLPLYAKWVSAQAPAVKLTSVSYVSKGTVKVSFDKVEHATSYEVAFSTDSAFSAKNTSTATVKKAGSYTVTNLLQKTYYVRIRAITKDSTDAPVPGAWSEVKTVAVKEGVKEVKAKLGKITLKKVVIKNGELHVTAKAPKRLRSSDVSYYLVTVDPATNKVLKKIADLPKAKSLEAYVPLTDATGNNLIQGKFAIAVKNGSKYKRMSKSAFISNPEAAATYTGAFPTPASKKGMQGGGPTELGLKHTFGNFLINEFIDQTKNPSNQYVYNGKTYYFNMSAINAKGSWISANNQSGIVVTAQFMLTNPGSSYQYLIMKGARSGDHPYYAMNGTEKKARETYEALFNLLGECWGREDCHLDNWIIGNEVNIHPDWYFAGGNSRASIMKTYADMFKIVYYGVRSHSKNSRVYICTDHTFNDRSGDWGAKNFMISFNNQIKKRNKKIRWNLAYHAYPAILTNASTWHDSYTSNSTSSEFVTPKNLNILTSFVKKKFGSKCRIILSEQGFTATSGEDVQAAGILYTYYKAQFNKQIDAVIFRSLNDADTEVQQGLAFGIVGRKAYNVFRYMDTEKSVEVARPYLNTIGASSWKKIIPGYKASTFKSL